MSRHNRYAPPQAAGAALLKVLAAQGLSEQARRLQIYGCWQEAVGAAVAAHTEVQRFDRGVLIVKSSSPAWQNELTFLKADILQRLNRLLGEPLVQEIRVVGGSISRGRRPSAPSIPPATPADLALAHDSAQAIPDEELRTSFKRLVVAARRAFGAGR